MEEDFFNNELIEKFEQMLENRDYTYYDSEDLCIIIEFYIEVNDNEYAKRALDFAEKMHPNNLEIKIIRIEYLLSIQELKRASIKIREIEEIAPLDINFLLVQAKYWGLKNVPKKAIRFYEKALEIDDEETDFICNCIGNEYLNLDEIPSAIEYFKRALLFDPENDYSFYSIIQCYNEIHNNIDCIEFLKEFIDNNPYSEIAWFQLGLRQLDEKENELALEALEYVLIINPQSLVGYTSKSYALEGLERYQEAIDALEESLNYDDSPAVTYFRIGQLQERLTDHQKALEYYHLAIKEDPQLAKAWACAAFIYNRTDQIDEAIHYIIRALELEEDNAEYNKFLILFYLNQTRYEEALTLLEKATKLKPLVFDNWRSYVNILLILQKPKKAIKILLEGALKNFNRAEFYYQLSFAYYTTEQDQLAEEAFVNALNLDRSLIEEMFEKFLILKEKKSYLI